MKDYIVLDLETPNSYSNSISSIGIVIVENGEVVDEIYSLINPEAPFESFNIQLTGIHPCDVENSPTFDEYWNEIKDLVCSNIIVGQNITFDLSVISRSLIHYNLPLPSFKYYCTLNSCKRYLNLPNNSLTYLVHNVLHKDYNAHNAMADAEMTNELYNFLENYDYDRPSHVKTYSYTPNYKRDFNRNLDVNINYLYGLIQKFTYSDEVKENHFNLIEQWYNDNLVNGNHIYFDNILLKLKHPLKIHRFTRNEMDGILKTMIFIKRSPVYSSPMLKLMVFKAIIDSFIFDDITKEDFYFIDNWVSDNSINDKEFKKFYKSLDTSDMIVLKKELMDYSKYLEEYIR